MPTQNDRLIAYLQAHPHGITQLEAFNKLGICRLSERCRELIRMGHGIIGTPERTPGGARVVRYRLYAYAPGSTVSNREIMNSAVSGSQ